MNSTKSTLLSDARSICLWSAGFTLELQSISRVGPSLGPCTTSWRTARRVQPAPPGRLVAPGSHIAAPYVLAARVSLPWAMHTCLYKNTKPPPPISVPPPNTIPPQILYPPWLNKRFAKQYTPFSSHTSKGNTNRFGTRSQHHYTVAHLKKAVIVVCLFTFETLLEAWATAAEGAAAAPSAPVTHTSATAASASKPDATHLDRAAYL